MAKVDNEQQHSSSSSTKLRPVSLGKLSRTELKRLFLHETSALPPPEKGYAVSYIQDRDQATGDWVCHDCFLDEIRTVIASSQNGGQGSGVWLDRLGEAQGVFGKQWAADGLKPYRENPVVMVSNIPWLKPRNYRETDARLSWREILAHETRRLRAAVSSLEETNVKLGGKTVSEAARTMLLCPLNLHRECRAWPTCERSTAVANKGLFVTRRRALELTALIVYRWVGLKGAATTHKPSSKLKINSEVGELVELFSLCEQLVHARGLVPSPSTKRLCKTATVIHASLAGKLSKLREIDQMRLQTANGGTKPGPAQWLRFEDYKHEAKIAAECDDALMNFGSLGGLVSFLDADIFCGKDKLAILMMHMFGRVIAPSELSSESFVDLEKKKIGPKPLVYVANNDDPSAPLSYLMPRIKFREMEDWFLSAGECSTAARGFMEKVVYAKWTVTDVQFEPSTRADHARQVLHIGYRWYENKGICGLALFNVIDGVADSMVAGVTATNVLTNTCTERLLEAIGCAFKKSQPSWRLELLRQSIARAVGVSFGSSGIKPSWLEPLYDFDFFDVGCGVLHNERQVDCSSWRFVVHQSSSPRVCVERHHLGKSQCRTDAERTAETVAEAVLNFKRKRREERREMALFALQFTGYAICFAGYAIVYSCSNLIRVRPRRRRRDR